MEVRTGRRGNILRQIFLAFGTILTTRAGFADESCDATDVGENHASRRRKTLTVEVVFETSAKSKQPSSSLLNSILITDTLLFVIK